MANSTIKISSFSSMKKTQKRQRKRVSRDEDAENVVVQRIRMSCSDPDATDSSSDEERDGRVRKERRFVREIVIVGKKGEIGSGDGESGRVGKPVRVRSEKKLVGVRQRKWGTWSAEIRNPITGKRQWLGTYKTQEEAHAVYMKRKMEIEEEKERRGVGFVAREVDGIDRGVIRGKRSKRVKGGPKLGSPRGVDEPETLNLFSASSGGSGDGSGGSEGQEIGQYAQNYEVDVDEGLDLSLRLGIGPVSGVIDNHGLLLGEFRRLDDEMWIN